MLARAVTAASPNGAPVVHWTRPVTEALATGHFIVSWTMNAAEAEAERLAQVGLGDRPCSADNGPGPGESAV